MTARLFPFVLKNDILKAAKVKIKYRPVTIERKHIAVLHATEIGGNKAGKKMSTYDMNRTDLFRDYPDVVNVKQLCEMLGGIGKNTGYRLLRERQIPSVLIGREYKVAKPDVIRFVLNITR